MKFLLLLIILISALLLLSAAGHGLSGLYLVVFFVFLTMIFSIFYFIQKKDGGENKWYRFLKFNYEIEVFLLVILALVWISLIDFFLVETFKTLQFDFSDNTYWVVMFGGVAPMFFTIIAMSFFVGTYHISHTVRIIVLSAFLLNANLNDLMYYKLFKLPFPDEWPWLYQPRFLFGEHVSSPELFVWVSIATIMGMIAFAFPYEKLVPGQFNYKNMAGGKKRMRSYEALVLACFFIFSITYAYYIAENINSSIRNQQTTQNFDTPYHIVKIKSLA
ncbi:MAG: hypothetical protein KAS07_04030 [Candidatus Pacebacteria bacterium]|nr:hypothetical protein [Candidatus Paceibacterota bacterium]